MLDEFRFVRLVGDDREVCVALQDGACSFTGVRDGDYYYSAKFAAGIVALSSGRFRRHVARAVAVYRDSRPPLLPASASR